MTIIELLKSALPNTQTEAAKLIQVSQPAIHKWMSGKGLPSPKTAVAIERAMTCARMSLGLRPTSNRPPDITYFPSLRAQPNPAIGATLIIL